MSIFCFLITVFRYCFKLTVHLGGFLQLGYVYKVNQLVYQNLSYSNFLFLLI